MTDAVETAVPSTAEPMELPRSGTDAYAEWRVSGTLPAKAPEAKVAETPTADKPEKTASESAPDPESGKPKQESRRKPDAEARIRELTERQKQLERELEEARKPKEAKADPPPARKPELTRPKPTVEDKGPDGKPKYATYEDFSEELADWKAEQRIEGWKREQAEAQQLQSASQKLTEARSRYEDFDSKAVPVIKDLLGEGVSQEVFAVLNDSPVLADLLYTIGGNEDTKADFLKAARENPGKALRVALLMEQEIVKELGKATAERNDKGQFQAKPEVETPVKRGPESAPKPPIEIGNRGAGPGDEEAQALSDLEAGKPGAFQRWKQAQDAKELRARRGA